MGALRSRVYVALEPAARSRGLSFVNILLIAAILLATGAAILDTEPLVTRGHEGAFFNAELVFGILFLIEYLARLWSAAENPAFPGFTGRIHFALRGAALLDLLAVISTLVPVIGINAMPLRMIRLLRILRLAKLGRMSRAVRHLVSAIAERREELAITGALALSTVIIAATLLYWLEGAAQPDKFGSIPRAMWWASVTLTTIGYGDVAPVTVAGKIASVILAMIGIGLIAIPTGILAAAFSDAMQRDRVRED